MNPQDPRYSNGTTYQPPQTYTQPTQPVQGATTPQMNPQGGYDVVPTPNPTNQAVGNGGHNPYEFIFSQAPVQKKGLLNSNSLFKRIAIFVSGFAVLAVIAMIAVNLLTPKDPVLQALYSIAQEQQEILRVTTLSSPNTANSDLKNYFVNIDMTIRTDQSATIKYLANQRVTIPPKEIGLKSDPAISKILNEAKATNQHDITAHETLQKVLTNYQKNLSSAYKNANGENAKKLLKANYGHAKILIDQGEKIEL